MQAGSRVWQPGPRFFDHHRDAPELTDTAASIVSRRPSAKIP
jgi:hypothetical protein